MPAAIIFAFIIFLNKREGHVEIQLLLEILQIGAPWNTHGRTKRLFYVAHWSCNRLIQILIWVEQLVERIIIRLLATGPLALLDPICNRTRERIGCRLIMEFGV